jgi:hypothetical protein
MDYTGKSFEVRGFGSWDKACESVKSAKKLEEDELKKQLVLVIWVDEDSEIHSTLMLTDSVAVQRTTGNKKVEGTVVGDDPIFSGNHPSTLLYYHNNQDKWSIQFINAPKSELVPV